MSDGAANIQAAFRLMEATGLLQNYFPCFAHTINLSVSKALNVPEIQRVLGKCRQLVAVFKHSYLKKLQLVQQEKLLGIKELQVIQDVCTRWNSALFMIQRLLLLMPAIYGVLISDPAHKHLIPSSDEHLMLEKLAALLAPFADVTKAVSAEKVPTVCQVMPTIHVFLAHLASVDGDAPFLKKAKEAIRADLRSRYQNADQQKFLNICALFDPRFKSLPYLDAQSRNEVHDSVIEKMVDVKDTLPFSTLVKVKKEKQDSEAKRMKTEEPSHSGDSTGSGFFDVIFVREEKAPPVTPYELCRQELDRYLREPGLDSGSANAAIIPWWKTNRGQFPTLTHLMCKYLNTPATSVPAERVFSSAGGVHLNGASLSTENANYLIFL